MYKLNVQTPIKSVEYLHRNCMVDIMKKNKRPSNSCWEALSGLMAVSSYLWWVGGGFSGETVQLCSLKQSDIISESGLEIASVRLAMVRRLGDWGWGVGGRWLAVDGGIEISS